MGELIIKDCTEQQFFSALASATVDYNNQPFFVTLDGSIICRINGDCFKLWPRSRVALPVIVGRVSETDNQVTVRWSHRLPLPMSLTYAGLLAFLLFNVMPLNLAAAVVCVAAMAGWILILRLAGAENLKRMESILKTLRHDSANQEITS